jgi:hypothetical protein
LTFSISSCIIIIILIIAALFHNTVQLHGTCVVCLVAGGWRVVENNV